MDRDATTGGTPVLEKGESSRVDVRLLVDPPAHVVPAPGVAGLARVLAPAFYLDVGNVCNQRCLYCAVPRDVLYRTSLKAAVEQAQGAANLGFGTAAFIGGEPTIWPHLHAALGRLPGLGVSRAILTTNGLMLAYQAELASLLALGVGVFGVSLDDFDPERQRRLCLRDDNPELLVRAMDNLAKVEADTYFYTVVTAELRGRGEWFGKQAAATASRFRRAPSFFLAALKPSEEAVRQADRLELSLTEAVAEVRAMAGGLAARGQRLLGADEGGVVGPGRNVRPGATSATLAVRDFPLCVLRDLLPHSMDLLHRNASLDLHSGRVEPSCLAVDRTFVEACSGCCVRDWCPAIYSTYLSRRGAGEFSPLVAP